MSSFAKGKLACLAIFFLDSSAVYVDLCSFLLLLLLFYFSLVPPPQPGGARAAGGRAAVCRGLLPPNVPRSPAAEPPPVLLRSVFARLGGCVALPRRAGLPATATGQAGGPDRVQSFPPSPRGLVKLGEKQHREQASALLFFLSRGLSVFWRFLIPTGSGALLLLSACVRGLSFRFLYCKTGNQPTRGHFGKKNDFGALLWQFSFPPFRYS